MHHSPKPQSSAGRSRHLRYVAIALATILGLGACASEPTALHVSEVAGSTAPGTADPEDGASAAELIYERLSNPPRTVVKDGLGQVAATFTDGARTVVVTGAERTFEESTATEATVTTTNWVRLAPREWSKGAEREDWFQPWFDAARRSKAKDVLGIAFEYVEGAPDGSKDGLRIKGDASFGPPNKTGSGRLEANDFYDYLGIDWKFSDVGTERAEARRYGSLDCSGYWRMVLGYRMGLKLRGSNDPGAGLPRRAYAIAEHGPGVVVVPTRGEPQRTTTPSRSATWSSSRLRTAGCSTTWVCTSASTRSGSTGSSRAGLERTVRRWATSWAHPCSTTMVSTRERGTPHAESEVA